MLTPRCSRCRPLTKNRDAPRALIKFYGLDHDARIRDWNIAMREGQRLRDEFADFVRNPDIGRIRPL